MNRPPELLVVAGEVSGDMHAARLLRALRERIPSVRFYGIGGDAMREAGAELAYHVRDMGVMGFAEVLRRLPFFRRALRDTVRTAAERRPDAVILVDYPGFNLRFAREAHDLGLKVIYYISPQVWAWNRRRIPAMAATVDRLLAIFPFEPKVFAGTGLTVDFVGHPLVDEIREFMSRPETSLPWQGPCRIALLPGSRVQEIDRLLPTLIETARMLESRRDDVSFLIPAPSRESGDLIRDRIAAMRNRPARIGVVDGAAREVLRQARAAFVKSGTATLEAALIGCPTVVVYKTSPLTYFLARRLIRVPHIGIANLIAGRALCPELVQGDASPPRLAATLEPLLDDGTARSAILDGYAEVRAALGNGYAAERAADVIAAELRPDDSRSGPTPR